jgi:serine/threonine-protein kinase SRPK3
MSCRSTSIRPLEEKNLPGYDPLEFYPVQLGELIVDRYRVVGKLGYGANSTVWFCRDEQ